MATLTCGKDKTYDTISSMITAASDTDDLEYYYTEFFDDPGVYWETPLMTAAKTLTLTNMDGSLLRNVATNANLLTSVPSAGKTHTHTGVRGINQYVATHGLYAQNVAGSLVVQSCVFHADGGNAIHMRTSGTGSCSATGCIGTSATGRGIWMDGTGAASGTFTAYNNTAYNSSNGVGLSAITIWDPSATITADNNFAYSNGSAADYYAYAGAIGGSNNRSTDGSDSTTDIGTIASASFRHWENNDYHILSGSGLDGVGTNVGTIIDIDGNSVDTSANPFCGASSIKAASSDPTNAEYYHDGNNYIVFCDASGNNYDRIKVKVTYGGTDYYLVEKLLFGRSEYVLTDDTTVMIPFLGTPIAFNTSETVTAVAVAWVNPNSAVSGYATATEIVIDYPAVGNVRDTDTVDGVTGTLASNNILKSNATGSGAGNYDDDNLSDGNVRPVAYGLAATGDLSNLDGSEAAFVALETARNTDPEIANVRTATNYKIHNAALTGTLVPGGNIETVVGRDVIVDPQVDIVVDIRG